MKWTFVLSRAAANWNHRPDRVFVHGSVLQFLERCSEHCSSGHRQDPRYFVAIINVFHSSMFCAPCGLQCTSPCRRFWHRLSRSADVTAVMRRHVSTIHAEDGPCTSSISISSSVQLESHRDTELDQQQDTKHASSAQRAAASRERTRRAEEANPRRLLCGFHPLLFLCLTFPLHCVRASSRPGLRSRIFLTPSPAPPPPPSWTTKTAYSLSLPPPSPSPCAPPPSAPGTPGGGGSCHVHPRRAPPAAARHASDRVQPRGGCFHLGLALPSLLPGP